MKTLKLVANKQEDIYTVIPLGLVVVTVSDTKSSIEISGTIYFPISKLDALKVVDAQRNNENVELILDY